MALLLNIDTATSYGAVALSEEGEVICAIENFNQKDHASFLHISIEKLLQSSGKTLSQTSGIVVTLGPGSYTGLRVGLSAAKGLCYALQKPLIGVNTLQAIALAAAQTPLPYTEKPVLFAPMIDARRMEVFTALFDSNNCLFSPPVAEIIDDNFLAVERDNYFIVAAGDGSKKLPATFTNKDFNISSVTHNISHIATIGQTHFENQLFEDVAYCEPFYLKPFFTTAFVKN